MPAQAHDAVPVDRVGVDARVLGVDVDEALAEVAHRARHVDALPDQVRRVEVQPEARVGQLREHLGPDGRRRRQVGAAGPFVVGEQHRAVLDADAHPRRVGLTQDAWPDLHPCAL